MEINSDTNQNSQVQYGASPKENVQSKAVGWLGVTGSTLLMLSATIFVWSGWNKFPNELKFGIIALIAALCFGTGKFLSKSLPVMGSIFTHLSIFLTPIVLLSGNMSGWLPWRQFLLAEGVFCVIWFYGVTMLFESKVLIPAALASTTLIALGLSSLEGTVFGSVPASVYMIPVIIGLCALPRFSRASVYVLLLVGVSPLLTLIQPNVKTGSAVLAGFGFDSNTHFGFPLSVAIGLFIATLLAARVQRSNALISIVTLSVLPYLILSFSSMTLKYSDLVLIVPLVLLFIQGLFLVGKRDEFFSNTVKSTSSVFNTLLTILQFYVVCAMAIAYTNFISKHYDDNMAFLTNKNAIGFLLFLCASINCYFSVRSTVQEWLLTFYGFFAVAILGEFVGLLGHTHRESRMLIASVVMCLVVLVFRRNYLSNILVPLSVVGIYVSVSELSTNIDRIIVLVLFITAMLWGAHDLREKSMNLLSSTTALSSLWLVLYGIFAFREFLPNSLLDRELYQIAFIFIGGLLLKEAFERLSNEKSWIETKNLAAKTIRPSRYLTFSAYASTWFLLGVVSPLTAVISSALVVGFGIVGTIRRRESLTLIFIAPTAVLGIYALGEAANIKENILSLTLIGIAGVWIFVSTYMKYAEAGCFTNAAICAAAGVVSSLNSSQTSGQAFFILGLLLIVIGVLRNVKFLIPLGAIVSTVGLWISFASQNVESFTLYVAPVSIGLIALGMYSRNVIPGFGANKIDTNTGVTKISSSWEAYGFGLSLFLLAALFDSLNKGLHVLSLIGAIVAICAIIVGTWRKLSAPMIIGTVFLFVFILREIFDVVSIIPIWAWIGVGALTLIGVAVTLEKSQMTPAEAKRKISAVVSDRFE